MAKRCTFILGTGEQCGGYAIGEGELCFSHSPQAAEAREEARRRGGRNRRAPRLGTAGDPPHIEGPGDILGILNSTLADAWGLERSERRVRSLISVAQAAIGEVTERRSSAWSAFLVACAAAHLDEDQVAVFRHELRDLAPAEVLSQLRPVDRRLPDIELARDLVHQFDWQLGVAVDPENRTVGAEEIVKRIGQRSKPLARRLADLRREGRVHEAEEWESFVKVLGGFFADALCILRPELLGPGVLGGENGRETA